MARAVAIKDEDVFLICDASGDVPLENIDGLGLYYHDCRYLDAMELRRLRVGKASVDLRFTRMPRGHVDVDVVAQHGDLRIDVEPAAKHVGAA